MSLIYELDYNHSDGYPVARAFKLHQPCYFLWLDIESNWVGFMKYLRHTVLVYFFEDLKRVN
jgi:hypothetical protein